MAKYLSLVYVCLDYMHTSHRYTLLTMAKYISLVYVCLGYMHTSHRYTLLTMAKYLSLVYVSWVICIHPIATLC